MMRSSRTRPKWALVGTTISGHGRLLNRSSSLGMQVPNYQAQGATHGVRRLVIRRRGMSLEDIMAMGDRSFHQIRRKCRVR